MKKIHTEFPQLLNKKKKILLLGKNSTLCKNFLTRIDKEKFDIFLYGKKNINFLNKKDDKKLHKILKRIQPDIIINFIGKFELNSRSNMDLFKINISPTWELISFYLKKKNDKKIKLLIIASFMCMFLTNKTRLKIKDIVKRISVDESVSLEENI